MANNKKTRHALANSLRALGVPFAPARKLANNIVSTGTITRTDIEGISVKFELFGDYGIGSPVTNWSLTIPAKKDGESSRKIDECDLRHVFWMRYSERNFRYPTGRRS